jgi:putative nucleotidyltransferase with HDIG domain
MTPRVAVYITGLAVLTALLTAQFDWSVIATYGVMDLVGIVAFLILGIASELLGMMFAVGPNRHVRSSIAFIPLFACAFHYPPVVAVLVAGSVRAISLIARRREFSKVVFNVSSDMLAIGVGSIVLGALGGVYSSGKPGVNFLAFTSFVLTTFSINLVLLSGVLASLHRRPFLATLRQAISASGSNMAFDFLASPIAFITAILYRDNGIGGLIMIVLPLMVIRSSYLSKLKLQQANRDLLQVLIKAIETRDPYTSGHSVRVATLSRFIAEDLGLPRSKCEQVENAALLHDIGKIDSTYSKMIRKPSSLTETERKVIQTHATNGAALLETLSSVEKEIVRAVRHHHERYDGNGYPDGLAGSEIPLAARIIMLSDSIDAMLSDRPYRRALTVEQAHSELERCAGSQFDPFIVDVILRRNTLHRAAGLVGTRAVDQVVGPVMAAR